VRGREGAVEGSKRLKSGRGKIENIQRSGEEFVGWFRRCYSKSGTGIILVLTGGISTLPMNFLGVFPMITVYKYNPSHTVV
jgi:hypothetical protein